MNGAWVFHTSPRTLRPWGTCSACWITCPSSAGPPVCSCPDPLDHAVLRGPHLQARQFIAGYARAPASTVGSVVLTDLATGRSWEGVDVAEVS